MASSLRKRIRLGTMSPPRIRIAHLSVTGTLHAKDNTPNQDSAFRLLRPDLDRYRTERRSRRQTFVNAPGLFAVGVFDGHGPNGEIASNLAAERMSYAVDRLVTYDGNPDLVDVLRTAFREVAAALNSADCGLGSGTTGTVVILRDGDLVIGNVGDSQAMLISSAGFARARIRYASPMHRPIDHKEACRIEAAGGYVVEGFVCDKAMLTGLAISRTLGDRDMHQYGCISEPSIHRLQLSRDDIAVVIASDGLWDHRGIDIGEIVKVVAKGSGRTARAMCHRVLSAASKYGATSDDCTVACMTFR